MSYVLFDIGSKKTKIAISSDLKTFEKTAYFKTPKKFEEGINMLLETVNKLIDSHPVAFSGGIRGRLSEEKDRIEKDILLTDWVGKSIVEALQQEYDVPVFLESNSALAGLGEAVFGAGEGLDIVAYHSVGTEFDGVRIENGKLDLASVAFEPGHQIVDIDRTVLGDEVLPTLENLVSGAGVENRLNTKPEDIPQSDLIWKELAEYLAQGLHNTIMYWSPDVIVLGGSMILGDPKIGLDEIRKATVDTLEGFIECPFITLAELGDDATLYGAMAVLNNNK